MKLKLHVKHDEQCKIEIDYAPGIKTREPLLLSPKRNINVLAF